MFSPLKKHDGIHQTYFSFCKNARNVNKLKWLRSLLILDSVIYFLILFKKLPRQNFLLIDFVYCSQHSSSFPSTPYPGDEKPSANPYSAVPCLSKQTCQWWSIFLQMCGKRDQAASSKAFLLDNPKQTAPRCGHPKNPKTSCLEAM